MVPYCECSTAAPRTAHARTGDGAHPEPRVTVAVPFGHWMRDGASANALTSDRFGDLGHGPTFCGALVDVSPLT